MKWLPRPPKRLLLMVLLFILGGAIINVAVAWGCALLRMANSPIGPNPNQSCVSSDTAPCWSVQWVHRTGAIRYLYVPVAEPHEYYMVKANAIPPWSSTRTIHFSADEADRVPIIVEDARGLPLHSMWCQFGVAQTWGVMPWATGVTGGIAISQSQWQGMTAAGSVYIRSPFLYARALPLRPIWPGFAINTIFYTAILWGLFAAPLALRRWRRLKRGLCPACVYPVGGGTSPVCTECGKPVHGRSVAPCV